MKSINNTVDFEKNTTLNLVLHKDPSVDTLLTNVAQVGFDTDDGNGRIKYLDNAGVKSLATIDDLTAMENAAINDVYYVSVTKGNDASAQKGNINKSYQTILAAVTAAGAHDVIHVFPGTYNEERIPTKSYLTIHLEDGVKIIPPSSGGVSPIFTDLVTGATPGGALNFTITGRGELLGVGNPQHDTTCIVASYANSRYYIEAKICRSVEAWQQDGAYVYFKNCIMDLTFGAYNGGELYFDGCSFINYGEVRTVNCYAASPTEFKITFDNCYFEKNGTNPTGVTQFGYDASEIFCIYPYGGFVESCDIIFTGCTFVQKIMGFDIIRVQSYQYDSSSLQFYNCKFYNIDPTKKAILFTTDAYTVSGAASTVGLENGGLKWFFNNNISNVDVDNVNTTYFITNELTGVTPLIVNPNFVVLTKNTGYDL